MTRPLKKCYNADKYRAVRPTKCNCDTCQGKWRKALEERSFKSVKPTEYIARPKSKKQKIRIKCLGYCGKMFISDDKVNNRMCKQCKG